jgi:hypothetical protein
MQRVDPRVAGIFAAALSSAACAGPNTSSSPASPAPSEPVRATAADQICRDYARMQKAQAADLMYDQCMYARGYLMSGFSPSPDTSGYQGPLLGPATIGSGN